MILEQYKTLQDAEVHTLLPDDIVDNLRHVLQCDAAKRKLVKGENGSAMEVDSGNDPFSTIQSNSSAPWCTLSLQFDLNWQRFSIIVVGTYCDV